MRANLTLVLYRIANRPEIIISGFFLVVLSLLVLTPLIEIIRDSFTYQSYDLSYRPQAEEGAFTLFHLERVFTGRLSRALFYRPLLNSLAIGVGVTALGGAEGMVAYFFGIQMPDWISYGMVPIVICLAPYYDAGSMSPRNDVPFPQGGEVWGRMKAWTADPDFLWKEGPKVRDFWIQESSG